MKTQDEDSIASFRLAQEPLIQGNGDKSQRPNLAELPRSYGKPIVFAVARDPKSLFVYWDIDWNTALSGSSQEVDVFLRLLNQNNSEVDRMRVEPLARSCDVSLPPSPGPFRVELGYFSGDQKWQNVSASEIVEIPSDRVGPISAGDFALVPFHITFQRLTELFRKTTNADGSIVQSLAELQEKANDPEKQGSLTPVEHEIFRAMRVALPEMPRASRTDVIAGEEERLRRKLERVLGFGAAGSSKTSLGGSSRGA